jgi:hypothetical protein
MAEFSLRAKAEMLAEHIAQAVQFADEHEDFVLGAKLTEALSYLQNHYLSMHQGADGSSLND